MNDEAPPRRPTIAYIGLLPDPVDTAIEDVPDDQALGGTCSRCEREGWIDRAELRRKWGNAMLVSLQPRLRCLECGNRTGNKWIVGRIAR